VARGLFAKYPRLAMSAVLLIGLVVVLLAFELGLRAFGSLTIDYYTGTKLPGLHRYPYGDVPINSSGFPDEEFVARGDKKRIGYVGDSVTYGIGAGYGYRLPDLLQARLPNYEHWVFAGVGERLDRAMLLNEVERFKLDAVIYLMNLNDIVPDADSPGASTWVGTVARADWFGRMDVALRGRSYLYTYIRFGLKNALERRGFEHHSMEAFELHPTVHQGVIEATTHRVASALAAAAGQREVRTCVVVLPYEMQVSSDAARVYKGLGFSWESGFEAGSTQQLLMTAFKRLGVTAFDAREAFSGRELKVGETFVYNKGDRVDWNHPNRAGHALLASWLATVPGFGEACLPADR
jgi:hypothetical protein